MTESSRPGDTAQPRGKRRLGAAIALGVCAFLWLLGLLDTSDPDAIVWFAGGLLTCLGGLAVALGRALVYRGDTWQPALVAAFASLLGPLSAVLLLLPPVWHSLREVPRQFRARNEVVPFGHTPDQAAAADAPVPAQATVVYRHTPAQAAAAHSKGASLALGLAAATLAFWSSLLVGVWLAFASETLTDGGWLALALLVVLGVGMVGFVGALVLQSERRVLAGLELIAAACMVASIVFVALERGDLHWSDGARASVGFLYWLWALVAILFLWGGVIARKGPGSDSEPLTPG